MKNLLSNNLEILLFISIYAVCFFIIRYLVSGGFFNIIRVKLNKNTKIIKINKNKNIFEKLDLLIEKVGIDDKHFWFNSFSVICICIVITIFSFIYFYNFFNITTSALLVSIPIGLAPIIILNSINLKNEENIEKVLSNFLIQLKNSTKISNDIIAGFKMVQSTSPKPLNSYIQNMLTKINSGIKVEDALDEFSQKINIKKFKLLIKNIKYCYIYGGSFSELLDKTQEIISDIEQEKNKRVQETRSARYILIILIIIDLYMYISFIHTKPEYLQILTRTYMGQLLLNINFISIWLVLWLAYWVKRLDY